MDDSALNAAPSDKTKIGICVKDVTNRRLIESAAVHLELVPILIEEHDLEKCELLSFELVIADEAPATRVWRSLGPLVPRKTPTGLPC